jgi:chromosomal replication initiator protein
MTEITKLSKDAAEIIAAAMGVRAEDILSKKRGGWVVSDSRFILYTVMAEEGYEHAEIGRAIGGRDRTSVLHGITELKSRRGLLQAEKRLVRALLEVEKIYPIMWGDEVQSPV